MQRINSVKDIGILVRQERKQQGLTQEQLAAHCGIGIRFLRELEQGKETCHVGKVLHVVQMLGVNLFCAKRNGSNN